jgi:hypothetical protein
MLTEPPVSEPDPVVIAMLPPLKPAELPDAMVTLPEVPPELVPVRTPTAPLSRAAAVRSDASPLVAPSLLAPLAITTTPPFPATAVKSPAAPDMLAPTVRLIDPALPVPADPDDTATVPLTPLDALPLATEMLPLRSSSDTEALATTTSPPAPPDMTVTSPAKPPTCDSPERICTELPAPAPLKPALMTTPPAPPAGASPDEIEIAPELLLTVEPLAIVTLPLSTAPVAETSATLPLLAVALAPLLRFRAPPLLL